MEWRLELVAVLGHCDSRCRMEPGNVQKLMSPDCQIPRQGRAKELLPTQFRGRGLRSFHLTLPDPTIYSFCIFAILSSHNSTRPSPQTTLEHRMLFFSLPASPPQPTIAAAHHGRQPLRGYAALPANIGVQDKGSRGRQVDDGAPARHHTSTSRHQAATDYGNKHQEAL